MVEVKENVRSSGGRSFQRRGAVTDMAVKWHRVKWQQFGTFDDVFKKYIRYIHRYR